MKVPIDGAKALCYNQNTFLGATRLLLRDYRNQSYFPYAPYLSALPHG